ncbi:PH domain-containing protein [Streptomyces sp. NBC_00457]|uniref:PH domain-containing protein n=1 Tax=unclassified Streptomyces TaxID=2593676 RepID=UPI002E214BDC|nr:MULTISPECIES: PH domain-containing protein [unclassified Streptomyces]
MIRYTIFAAAVTSGAIYLVPWGMGLPSSTRTGITVAGLVAILIVVVRILRLGTVVAADGVTRRGFLADRHHPWSDIHELEVIDRQVVHVAYGFQVTSRFVVRVAVGQRRRRKTLLFLDERGFTGADRFRAELDTVAALWDQQRAA